MSTEREYWYLKDNIKGNFVAKTGIYKSLPAIPEKDFFESGPPPDWHIKGDLQVRQLIDLDTWRQLRKEYLQKERTRLKTELMAVEKELNSIAYKKMVERLSNAANDETID